MQNAMMTAKLTFAVLLFFSTLVAAFWPQGLGITFDRPNQLNLGFSYLLLLTQALVAAVAVEYWPRKERHSLKALVTLGFQLTLILISTMPIAALLYWGGYLALEQLLMMYGAAFLALWGFTALALRKRSHLQVATVAVMYLLGLSALILFWELTPWILAWNGVVLVVGVGHWWLAADRGGERRVGSA